MKFELDKLPYPPDALDPHISGETVELHYHKHHAGYMKKLADEIEGKSVGNLPLDEIVKSAPAGSTVLQNAAQVWNHTFYWNSLAPDGGADPDGRIAGLIERDFGGVARFKRAYAEAALAAFGSGWTWLVLDKTNRLAVFSTSDADNPMCLGHRPLLNLDIWEHAYYLDYRNERGKYVEACIEHLLNWAFAETNLELAAVDREAAA